MVKKTAWMLVLLVALLVISVSVAFAANITRPAQAKLAPQAEISIVGSSQGALGVITQYKSYGKIGCPFEDDSAVAY